MIPKANRLSKPSSIRVLSSRARSLRVLIGWCEQRAEFIAFYYERNEGESIRLAGRIVVASGGDSSPAWHNPTDYWMVQMFVYCYSFQDVIGVRR